MFARLILAYGCALLLAVGARNSTAQQTAAFMQGQQAADLAQRDMAIHWPKGFDPTSAAQFSHNELLIHAPCAHVFARMADVTDWPNWFLLVKDVRVEGPEKAPALGRTLSLRIFGTPITSTITEWVPASASVGYPRAWSRLIRATIIVRNILISAYSAPIWECRASQGTVRGLRAFVAT